MIEGIYSISFRGRSDWGMGMLHLQNGMLTGADAAGITYEGRYSEFENSISFNVKMTVPPDTPLVQGTAPQSVQRTIEFDATVSKSALDTGAPVTINMPPGPVNVIFRRLRSLPA